MSADNLYSMNNRNIKDAATDLLNNNADYLINYIYQQSYAPEVRIGLSIRILAKTNRTYNDELINLILSDIEKLRNNTDYLLGFSDPKSRREALDEEYALVQGYIDMNDTISLNQDPDEIETKSTAISKIAAESGCTIV